MRSRAPQVLRISTRYGTGDITTTTNLNLFAYCGNDPVSNIDPNGESFWDAFTQALEEAQSYFGVAVGVVQIDTPAPVPADLVAGGFILVAVLYCAGSALVDTITSNPQRTISLNEPREEI